MEMGEMKKKVFDTDTEITFGVYKDHTIEEIFEVDCQYLVWMYENFENVEWSDDVELLVTQAMDIMADDRRSARFY